MKTKDAIKAKPKQGTLQIVGIRKDGSREILKEHNLIVDNAVNILRRAISQQNFILSHLVLGTDTTGEPSPTATALHNQVLAIAFSEVTYPTSDSVKFTASVDYEVGNGLIFTEAGLSAEAAPTAEKLFAVKRHGGVMKNDELILEYNWTIVFQ